MAESKTDQDCGVAVQASHIVELAVNAEVDARMFVKPEVK